MKKVLLLTTLIISVVLLSCTKNDDSSSSSGDDNNNTQEQLYEWFINNGWNEAIVAYGTECFAHNSYGVTYFIMCMDEVGNILSSQYAGGAKAFKIYSSFDKVKELTIAPDDGYTDKFVCEQNRAGISKVIVNYDPEYPYNGTYYCKFYVERINSSQVKVYYKEWYSVLE